MEEAMIVKELLEALGMIGLMLLWLKDKNEALTHERTARQVLSENIIKDWLAMADKRRHREISEAND